MMDPQTIDLCEEMLFQRAARGIRPLLYISSYKDFECSMLLLPDEGEFGQMFGAQRPNPRAFGCPVLTH